MLTSRCSLLSSLLFPVKCTLPVTQQTRNAWRNRLRVTMRLMYVYRAFMFVFLCLLLFFCGFWFVTFWTQTLCDAEFHYNCRRSAVSRTMGGDFCTMFLAAVPAEQSAFVWSSGQVGYMCFVLMFFAFSSFCCVLRQESGGENVWSWFQTQHQRMRTCCLVFAGHVSA